MSRTLRCYAEGREGKWEANCLDLDIAVQGDTFEEVFQSLSAAVVLYLKSVDSLPEGQRRNLLVRPSPLSVRLRFIGLAMRSLLGGRDQDKYYHQFTMPLAA